ncbi:MAG: hypothetical protein ACI4PO_08040 [Faecousia sp.]
MAKIIRIAKAGPLTIETIYPAPRPRESFAARQGRINVTSQAMRYQNIRYAYQRLELQLAANIRPGDWKVVLTYQPDRLPKTKEAAKKDFSAFIRRLRKYRCDDWCYFYRLEHKHKAGNRYHFHIYMTAGPESKDDLTAIWGNGIVYLDPIIIDADNPYEQLARYMVKEAPDKLGQHLYDHSHHIKKPEYERIRVPEDTQLIAPAGSMVLMDTGKATTLYGEHRTIKYMQF